jgi:transposase
MQRYFKRLRAGESLEDKHRPGRPAKLTSTLRRRLAQIKARNPKKSARWYAQELSRMSGQPVGVTTVKKALRQLKYRYRLIPRRQLTSAQKAARVAFAQAHRGDAWARRWSFDESYFNLYRNSNRYWVRVKTDDAASQPSRPKLSEAQEKVSVGIAVAVSRGRKSALAFLPKNWKATDLVDAFERVIYPSLGWSNRRGYEHQLMIDHDGRHHTAAWREYAAQRRLRPLDDWPSNAPDLNPIENVFAWMKRFVESKDPRSEQQLREAVQEAWDTIPVDMTLHGMDSMPDRLELVLKRRGGRTSY